MISYLCEFINCSLFNIDENLSQHGLQNLSVDLGCEKIVYVGNKELYFNFSDNYKAYHDLIEDDIKYFMLYNNTSKVEERPCNCPLENFSWNGRGCTCGGK